eukprot:804905-Pleurochrysis_carterae.AAC.2
MLIKSIIAKRVNSTQHELSGTGLQAHEPRARRVCASAVLQLGLAMPRRSRAPRRRPPPPRQRACDRRFATSASWDECPTPRRPISTTRYRMTHAW